jgi:hypothetical protein
VREVMDYVWHPATPESYRAMTPMQRAMHRVKWSWLGAGVYYGWDIWWKNMMHFQGTAKIAANVKRDRRIVWVRGLVNVAVCRWRWVYGSVGGALWMWFALRRFVPGTT